jgi:hypothetical protein
MNRALLYDAGSATLAEGQMNDTVAASAIRSIAVSFLTGGGEMAALINAYDCPARHCGPSSAGRKA